MRSYFMCQTVRGNNKTDKCEKRRINKVKM